MLPIAPNSKMAESSMMSAGDKERGVAPSSGGGQCYWALISWSFFTASGHGGNKDRGRCGGSEELAAGNF